jgi:predicted porin
MLKTNIPSASAARQSRRSTTVTAAIAAALALSASTAAFADSDSELNALKKQVQELQQKIDALAKQQAQAPAATPAPAASAAPAAKAPSDGAFSMYGITLSGVLDVGVTYANHAAPISDYFGGGLYSYIQKYNTRSIFTASENNLSQSRITISGEKEILNGWSGIFRLETAINPLSGNISDALKSLTNNNGKPCGFTAGTWNCTYTTGADSSVNGELFNSAAFVGFQNKEFGTVTIGRQNGLLADGIAKFDPMAASQAFSVIGISGTAGGGGNTENRRLDSSVKYNAQFGPLHAGVQYQFNGSSGSAGNAWQLVLGGTFPSVTFDAFYAKKEQAIGAASLSAAQVSTLNCPYVVAANPVAPCTVAGGGGNALDKALSGTITDNTAFAFMTQWNIGKGKLFASYEHIQYLNPSTPLTAGSATLGGYILAYVNNASIPVGQTKVVQFEWVGFKYPITPSVDWTIAAYRQVQGAFATGANSGCSDTRSGQCSGNLTAYSTDVVYHLSKRFDAYGGAMWSEVQGGLANGFLVRTEINPTVGVRLTF